MKSAILILAVFFCVSLTTTASANLLIRGDAEDNLPEWLKDDGESSRNDLSLVVPGIDSTYLAGDEPVSPASQVTVVTLAVGVFLVLAVGLATGLVIRRRRAMRVGS